MLNQVHKNQPVPKEAFQVGQRAHDGSLRKVLAGGNTSEETTRLHQLLFGPGNFHVLVFTSDLLSTTSAPRGTDKNGVVKTNEHELRQNVEKYLAQWRSKWAYGTHQYLVETTGSIDNATKEKRQALFHIHLIAALPETLTASDFKDPTKIQADSLATKAVGEGALFLDDTSIVHERYGIAPIKAGAGAIVVVRPDSHLGYRVLGAGDAAWQDVDQYFKSILF